LDRCPDCGENTAPGWNSCPRCGHDLSSRVVTRLVTNVEFVPHRKRPLLAQPWVWILVVVGAVGFTAYGLSEDGSPAGVEVQSLALQSTSSSSAAAPAVATPAEPGTTTTPLAADTTTVSATTTTHTVTTSSQVPTTTTLATTTTRAPAPTVAPTTTTQAPTTTTSAIPADPGNTKNCRDFDTQAAAQAWFDLYYPSYGDVAKLDGNKDLIVCENLP